MTQRNLSDVLSEKRLELRRELQEERERLRIETPEGWQQSFIYLGQQMQAINDAESLELDESIAVVVEALVGLMAVLPGGDRRDRVIRTLGNIDQITGGQDDRVV